MDDPSPADRQHISKDGALLAEHGGLKEKLIENMFKVDDFLLWEQRGLSDEEANERIR